MDSTEAFNSIYSKEFETEISQIQYWIATLKATSSQVTLLRDSIDQELKLHEGIGTIFQNAAKVYNTETKAYSEEPSNLLKNMSIFSQFMDAIGKIFCTDLLAINTSSQKISSAVINDINSVLSNIKENSSTIMTQILEQRKNSKSLKISYQKLKSELDQTNLDKKKIETDPKRVYNVTIKEKAELNVLGLIKKMEELLPVIETSLKEVENKDDLFNKFMKETFELVISNNFKNSIIIIKNCFKIFQEKFGVWEKLKSLATEFRNKLRDSDLLLNDYSEKKYSESKRILFDCIDSIEINENVLDVTLVKTIDDMQNYTINFFTCMRMRKRVLSPFAKLISEVFKGEDTAGNDYSKINNTISESFQNFSLAGQVGVNNWDLIRSAFDQNQKMHDLLARFLESNILKMILSNKKESKNDYREFSDNFKKHYAKEFSNSKLIILKYNKSRDRLIDEIKSIRTQINKENGRTVSKLEIKLKSLQKEENSLKLSHVEIGKKLKLNLTTRLEDLHKNTKSIRLRESERLVTFLDSIESVIKTYEKIFDQNLEISKNLIEVIAHTDIYVDMRIVFEKYFAKFKINNYEAYFDRIFKKILTTFNLNQIDKKEGKDLINDYFNKISLNKLNKYGDISGDNLNNNYDSPNINNFISNNLQNYNTNIPFSTTIDQFNSGSNENSMSSNNFKENRKFAENIVNEIEMKNSSEKYFRNRSESVINNLNFDKKRSLKKVNYQMNINKVSINKKDSEIKNSLFVNNINDKQMRIDEEASLDKAYYSNKEYSRNKNSVFEERESKNPIMFKLNEMQNYSGENSQKEVENHSIKSDVINLNHKPDLYFSNENEQENLAITENVENQDFNRSFTSSSSDEDNIDFVTTTNFKFLEIKNPYNNIKENDLKDYMDKIKTNRSGASNNLSEINVKNKQLRDHHRLFKLEGDERVVGKYFCAFSEKILLQGRLYITNKKLIFYSYFNSRSLLFGSTKLIIPMIDILNVEKKKNLKIFDNSLKITTNKSELFFTSFVQRDACFKAVNENWLVIKNEQNINENLEENLNEIENIDQKILSRAGTMPLTGQNKLSSKTSVSNKILKKIDFLNRLEKIHSERLSEFESIPFHNSNLQASFKPESMFKKIYLKDEPIGNCPLPLIFNSIFRNDVICDEMELNKTFFTSIYESRKDYDIVYEEIPANESVSISNVKIPKFIDDIDYFISLFSNVDENNLNELIDDVAKWPKSYKFTYQFIHPIKKKIVGPDRINLKEHYNCYFVSPKLFIVEITCYGINFPYAENFVTFTQYKFNTNYKFNPGEGVFKFNTSMSLMFTVHFIKSCIFSSIIENEGHKESEENLRFYIYEKVRKVLDNQTDNFNQHFNKLNEENMRRTLNHFFSKNSEYMVDNKTAPGNKIILLENQQCDIEDEISEAVNGNDTMGWNIKHVLDFELKSNYGGIPAFSIHFYKNHFISVIILFIIFYILSTLTRKVLPLGYYENLFSSSDNYLLAIGISFILIVYSYIKLK